jgi:hypothetical protein
MGAYLQRRRGLNKNSKTSSSQMKAEIQDLLRRYSLQRDGGCVFRGIWFNGKVHQCSSNQTKDGHLVLQYDHLNPRERNVSYANPDLGVIICQGLHGWKSFSDYNKQIYDEAVRDIIGPERSSLWDRVKQDHKSYPKSAWDWQKDIIYLKSLLNEPV